MPSLTPRSLQHIHDRSIPDSQTHRLFTIRVDMLNTHAARHEWHRAISNKIFALRRESEDQHEQARQDLERAAETLQDQARRDGMRRLIYQDHDGYGHVRSVVSSHQRHYEDVVNHMTMKVLHEIYELRVDGKCLRVTPYDSSLLEVVSLRE